MMTNTLLEKSATKVDAVKNLRSLREFLNYWLFDDQQKSDLAGLLKIKDDPFLNSFPLDFYQQFTAANLNNLLQNWEDSISKAKLVIIYLPFDLPEKNLLELSGWFKQNLGPQTLIEIKYAPGLIGGAALSFDGHYKDYSLKQKIEENRARILQSLVSFRH